MKIIDFYDIHRHDQYSLFDGFGNADQVAEYAKELGYKAVGSTNHGNITGLIQHYKACEKNGINPILGCEFYFQPKIDKEKKTYHLCLYASNMEGWKNINRLISESNKEENYYYKNRIDFSMLKEFNEGIVCSSACVAGIISQAIIKGKIDKADEIIKKFKAIYGKRFFIEIQPFELHGENEKEGKENTQIKVNEILLKLAKQNKVYPIITSDSHFVKKDEFDTYLKMHEIKKSTLGIGYKERYMHSKKGITKKILKYHPNDFEFLSKGMDKFYEVIGDSREWFKFNPDMPKYTDDPDETFDLMKKQCIKFLKKNDKFNKKYQDRLKFEFDVIKYHGFQDYFMVVQEYVNWAKKNDIAVGPGRGSAGNSLTNYALGITLVDPLVFGNNFDRFLRKDKKKFPDIDCDFGQDRRDEVINHIIKKYEGCSAQTLTYGKYNVKNLINDLAKVCNCIEKQEIEAIKKFLFKYCNDNENTIDDGIYRDKMFIIYNNNYDNIITHFVRMYGKVRYFGTHASSVILSSGEIGAEAGLCRVGGNIRTSFDLHDIEFLGLLKLDILGLSSATQAKELEKMTGEKFSYNMLNDKKMLKVFNQDPTGVFQFESRSAVELVNMIGVDSFEDIVASVALNRPGPLTLGMHEQYKQNKIKVPTNTLWYKYTKSSFGTLIYQEQAMEIAKEIGGYDSNDADKIAKYDAKHIPEEEAIKYRKMFVSNAIKNGLKKEQANELFDSMLGYSFNRGHAVAYAMLSAQLAYYKAHYPEEFWCVTLKHEWKEDNIWRDERLYVNSGGIIFTPHVNGTENYELVEYDGHNVLLKGISTIKNVGEKAAKMIIEEKNQNGPYKDIDDFDDRLPKRVVNARVRESLKAAGALTFNKKRYLDGVMKYNIGLASR